MERFMLVFFFLGTSLAQAGPVFEEVRALELLEGNGALCGRGGTPDLPNIPVLNETGEVLQIWRADLIEGGTVLYIGSLGPSFEFQKEFKRECRIAKDSTFSMVMKSESCVLSGPDDEGYTSQHLQGAWVLAFPAFQKLKLVSSSFLRRYQADGRDILALSFTEAGQSGWSCKFAVSDRKYPVKSRLQGAGPR